MEFIDEHIDTRAAELNGHSGIKERHIFIQGHGPFYPTLERAIQIAHNPNGVNMWRREVQAFGQTWYKCGYRNVWN